MKAEAFFEKISQKSGLPVWEILEELSGEDSLIPDLVSDVLNENHDLAIVNQGGSFHPITSPSLKSGLYLVIRIGDAPDAPKLD